VALGGLVKLLRLGGAEACAQSASTDSLWKGVHGLVGPRAKYMACRTALRASCNAIAMALMQKPLSLKQSKNMGGGQCIEVLPAVLVAKLRAPLVIRSLAQTLEELAANSIDARATRIEIDVNVAALSLTVVDDGCGIPQASFASVAGRHCTSKLQDQKQWESGIATLGFKGEALASIAEVALLQLTSKAAGAFETHMKLLKGGKVIKQGLASEQRQKSGTVVCVKDFLFNQPVKRRHFTQTG